MTVRVNKDGESVERMGGNSTRAKEKEIFMRLADMEKELHNKVFSDQMVAFPFGLSKGTRYMIVMLEYNSKNIMVEGM